MSTILKSRISHSLLALPKVQSASYAPARWDQTLKQHSHHLRKNVDDVNFQLDLEAFDLYLKIWKEDAPMVPLSNCSPETLSLKLKNSGSNVVHEQSAPERLSGTGSSSSHATGESRGMNADRSILSHCYYSLSIHP
jgi:hypothetical protein